MTHLPWKIKVYESEDSILRTITGTLGGGGNEIAILTTGSYSDNDEIEHGELIVRAVNNHAALLAALKALVADVQEYEAWQRPCLALDMGIAAITLAEEGTE